MSNAKYRNHVPFSNLVPQVAARAARQDLESPTTQKLLAGAKAYLSAFMETAQKSLDANDGRVSVRDGLAACRHIIAIARIEQRAVDREERKARQAAADARAAQLALDAADKQHRVVPARAVEPTGAPGLAPSPAPDLRPAPEFAAATASPAPAQLPPPPQSGG
ncbi:MAG: hypothetical protein IT462_03520 [Planctomycetes bacterium]|nr:hypothetical protein [Planctomycetota bacterium]